MKKRGDIGSIKNVLFTTFLLLAILVAVKLLIATPDDISYTPASGSYLYGNSSEVFTVVVNETILDSNATLYYRNHSTDVVYTSVAMTCVDDPASGAPNSSCINNTVDLSSGFGDGAVVDYYFKYTNENGTNYSGAADNPHYATLDMVDPVITEINITSDKSDYINVSSKSTSAATVYFNSVSGEGGGQVVTITVVFTDDNPANLTGNASLGNTSQTNSSANNTLSISYTINDDENSNATLINVTDKVGRTDSAIITWTQDNTDPSVTLENITEDSDFLYNDTGAATIYFGDDMGDTEQSFVIEGNATDAAVGLLKVSFSTLLGDSPFADTTEPGNWSATYDANSSDSAGTITITATDIVGNNGTATVTVTKDTTNPVIALENITENSEFLYNDTGNSKLYFGDDMNSNQTFEVQGNATDANAGLYQVVFNTVFADSPSADTPGGNWTANYSVNSTDANATIVVTAIDNVGNNNTANISVILDDQNPTIDSATWEESSDYLYLNATGGTLYFSTNMPSGQLANITGTASDTGGSGLQKVNFTDEGVFGNAPSDDTSPSGWGGPYYVNSSATATNSPVNVTVVDNVGNTYMTGYVYAADSTAPTMSSFTPTNTSVLAGNDTEVFTITANENITNAILYYKRSQDGAYTETTMSCTEATCINNSLDLSSTSTYADGQIIRYYYTFSDLAFNNGTYGGPTDYNYVTIDRNNMSIGLMSPADSAWEATQTPTFIFNFTDSVSKNASCIVYVDNGSKIPVGANTSVLNGTKTTIVSNTTLSEGTKTWNVSCTDLAAHTNESTVQSFTVDVNDPVVSLETNPADDSWTTSTTPDFEFNVTDAGDTTLNCSLYVDGDYNMENSSTLSANHTVITADTLSQATHTWFIRCEDSGGLSHNSSTRTLNVDDTVPTVNLMTTNYSWTNDNTTTFIFNVTDNLDNASLDCALGINNANYSTNTSVQNNTETTLTINNTNGLSDNDYIWNITCTDSAGKQNVSEIYTIRIDTNIPAVALETNPADDSWTSDVSPDFEFNVTDASDTALDCILYVDGSNVGQNQSTLSNNNTVITSSDLSQAQHTWYVNCTDNASNTNMSATRTLYVDNTVPTVNLMTTNYSWTNDNTTTFIFNVTDNLDNASLDCALGINNANYSTNTSVQNNTETTLTINNTNGLSDNDYIWNITCTDSAGKQNVSEIYTIRIDTNSPEAVNLESPADNAWSNDLTPDFAFNFTDIQSVNASCTLYLGATPYGTNVSVFNNTMTTITANASLTSGTNYTWNVTCTDLAGNTKYGTGRNIQIDNVAPTVTLVLPEDNNWSSDTTPDFYFNVTDATAINFSCTLYIDDVSNQTNTSVPVDEVLNGFTPDAAMSEAQHTWNITCTDPAANTGNSGARTINIDNTAPAISLMSTNNTWTNDTTYDFIFNVTDNLDTTLSCNITVDGSDVGSNTSTLNNTATTITSSALSEGTQYWNVTCTDSAGKSNTSVLYIINVDTTAPSSIELRSPANNSWGADLTPNFIFNVTDNLDTTLNCTVYVDGSSVGSNATTLNNTATTITSSALSDDTTHTWYVTCEDSAGNFLTSGTMNHPISMANPEVWGKTPPSGNTTSNRSQIVTFVSTSGSVCKFDPYYSVYSDMRYNMTDSDTNHTANLSSVFTIDKQYVIKVICNNSAAVRTGPLYEYIINLDTRSSYSIVRPSAKETYFEANKWDDFELPLWVLQNTSSLGGNYNVTTVLASIDGNYTSFYGHNGSDWLSYNPGATTNSFKNFTYNDVGKAYYIYTNTSDERIEIT